MLSVTDLIYTLSSVQEKIINNIQENNKEYVKCHDSLYNRYVIKNKFDTKNIYSCISDIIGNNFYIYKSIFKNSFIESLLNILSDKFILSNQRDKKKKINLFREKIGYDLNDKNLYYKFGYNKNRNIKKSRLQKVLLDLKKPIINDDIIFQLISNYLDINIFIFNVSPYITLDSVYCYYSKIDSDRYCKFKPTIFLVNKNNKYEAILSNKHNIINYSVFSSIIDNLYDNYIKDNIEKELEVVDKDEEDIDHNVDLDDSGIDDGNANDSGIDDGNANDSGVNDGNANDSGVDDGNANDSKVKNEDKNYVNDGIINDNIVEDKNKSVEDEGNIDNCKKVLNKKYLKSMKISELREFAEKRGITIYKKSTKTNKDIFKLKIELINDILNN